MSRAALRQVFLEMRVADPLNSNLHAPPPKSDDSGFGNVNNGLTANRFSFKRADWRYASRMPLRWVTSSFVWGSWNAQQKPSSVSTRTARRSRSRRAATAGKYPTPAAP